MDTPQSQQDFKEPLLGGATLTAAPQDDESNSSQTETLSQKIEDKLLEATQNTLNTNGEHQVKEKPKLDEDLSTGAVMRRIYSLAIYPIIGMLFHPSYHICNSIILGQMED